MLNDDQILRNLERHSKHPETSAFQYFRLLQGELVGRYADIPKLYLDTKYWVLLRDAALGRARRTEHNEILVKLRALVARGVVICPLSDAAYVESMQQTDRETRLATAAVMDELSCGLAIATEQTRARLELLNFMADPASDVTRLDSQLWVKSGFVLGETVPHSGKLDARTNLTAQKSFIDLMWNQTLADFAADERDRQVISLSDSAERITAKMAAHADEIRSFEQAVAAEISGCVKLFDHELAATALCQKGYANATSEEVSRFQEAMQRGMFNAMRLKPDFMAKRTPTLFIHAMCHAAIRWDKHRKLDSHWIFDIHHACAALPYHAAMFTEHPLRALLLSGKMQMAQRFSTQILSAEADILRYLENF